MQILLAILFAVFANLAVADPLPELRVAAVQMEVTPDVQANLARIERGIAEGKAEGARLVLFPETALSGFDRETIAALDWEQVAAAMGRVAAAAREQAVYVLYGCATRSPVERPYNSAILVGPDGGEITRYHKMAPEAWFEPGDHLAYFEVDGIPCTMIVCHDNRFPELVRIPVLRGARVCFYLSYEINGLKGALRKMENYRAQLIARAAENGIWLVQANGVGPLSGADAVSLGHSRVIDPGGVVLQELPGMEEGMYVETIAPERARRGNAVESLGIKPLEGFWAEGLKVLEQPEGEVP